MSTWLFYESIVKLFGWQKALVSMFPLVHCFWTKGWNLTPKLKVASVVSSIHIDTKQ